MKVDFHEAPFQHLTTLGPKFTDVVLKRTFSIRATTEYIILLLLSAVPRELSDIAQNAGQVGTNRLDKYSTTQLKMPKKLRGL